MIRKVRLDLSALATPDPMATEVTGTLAGALRVLTSPVSKWRGGRATREPKGIDEHYKETYRTLLRFCNVTSAEAIAPLWRRLANCLERKQHTIIMQEFQRICSARVLSKEFYVLVVTSSLKQMIVGLQFVGHGMDDLGSRCQPFMVVFSGSTNHRKALEAANVDYQLAQGEHSASLADYVTLRAGEKMIFPRDITELGITIGNYAVLCQALFHEEGPDNPLVNLMWKLFVEVQNSAPSIADKFPQQVAHLPTISNVLHTYILRAIQVHVHDYLHAVSVNVADNHTSIDKPEFRGMVADLKHGTFPNSSNWVPIPVEYREPVRAGGGGPSGWRAPSAVPTRGSLVSLWRTGVLSLTANSTPRAPMTTIDNPVNDDDFRIIAVRPGGTRLILRDIPPPHNDTGREFFVSWWVRGLCYPNCRRREAHVPFASPGEQRTRLVMFCRTHLPASPAGANGKAST
jgi:hypothetical protein